MTELVSAEISLSTEGLAECESLDLINRKLSDVEENLKRYTCTETITHSRYSADYWRELWTR